jgi:GNAT superfamily N-acetyltransferase
MTSVRKATTADVPKLSAALAAAFADDPIMEWMLPSALRNRPERLRKFHELALRRIHLPNGEVYTTDGLEAGAEWDPPGHWRLGPWQQMRLLPSFMRTLGSRLGAVLSGLTLIEKKHPREPHFYLGILGTDPEHQGKGFGSALLQPVLERCDADGVPAYLESSKEANIPFYNRHGFEVTDTLHMPKGPPIWPMWRDPKPAL